MQVDFAQYKKLIKNQQVVSDLEKTWTSFKPVDYDVAAQVKAIDSFQEKAVSLAFSRHAVARWPRFQG